jgi:hypothetical protein
VTRRRLVRTFWIGAAAALVVAALIALAAIVRGDFSDTDGRILITLAALLYAGGTSLAGLALVDRGSARILGWIVAGIGPAGLAVVLWAIWSFVFEGENEPASKLGWSSVLVLLAALVSSTALLLAQREALVRLAWGAGALAGLAAVVSIAGIWAEPHDKAFIKIVAILWILTGLAYFLVPILQRMTSTGSQETSRVLAELDGIELVATRSSDGVEPRLERGERLALRRSASSGAMR